MAVAGAVPCEGQCQAGNAAVDALSDLVGAAIRRGFPRCIQTGEEVRLERETVNRVRLLCMCRDLIGLLCSTMDYIREEAPIIIHFHLDKCVDFFIKDTVAVMCLCAVLCFCALLTD